ncbi:hypothetical protein FK178_09925 [Antarcticibacterium arcticum]|uniref:Uncharacterized protein n=1 Tax=Antarcticibacterium arcticum TaxID=2585771 RepID=A0A5B8YK54_9FLAO|nr:hypothetical protein [Antarcticibacterium arcticum]QED38021.1 hypothetical protein FK178_09925 [Antarcticibacterium arcticum]
MNKFLWVFLALIWIAALIVLIIALTENGSNDVFADYKFIIGIGFIAITGFLRILYKRSKVGN